MPERKLTALSAEEAVFLHVIPHILNTPDLPLEFLRFPSLVICRLDKADLPVLLQKQIILQALISGVRSHFFILGLLSLLHMFQKRNQRAVIRSV